MSSKVYRHRRSGGELHQGGKHSASFLAENPQYFDSLVVCNAESELNVDHLDGLTIPLRDVELRSTRDLRGYLTVALEGASFCATQIKAGRRVLVTCAAGLNRSGLVSGLTLRLLGIDPDEAVRLIREARGPAALSNRSFEHLVRSGLAAPVRAQLPPPAQADPYVPAAFGAAAS